MLAALLAAAALVACIDRALSDPRRPDPSDGNPAAPGAGNRAAARGETFAGLARCAEVWWQPLREGTDPTACTPAKTPEEFAAIGGVVLVGATADVSEQRTPIPKPTPCKGHAPNREFIRAVRRAQTPGSPSIASVHLHRFDLVPLTFAALTGFQADFLVPTRTPWNRVLDFFARDEGPTCRGGRCSWSDFHFGNPDQHSGPRLRDLIDASGGPGAHERVVYYLTRSKPGKQIHWPDAALADLRDPVYRAWRVAEARRALEAGGYDAILLNDKFAQYRARPGHWLGASARDVEALNRVPRTLWSAEPDGYGYAGYASGWAALGRDLRAAGVPYAVWMSASAWWGRGLDDRDTEDVDEGALLRETVRGASLFLVTKWGTPEEQAGLDGIERELRARGAALVLASRARAICR